MQNELNRQEFLSIFQRQIASRPGADKLLEWLESTDFFTAPASTRFHGAWEGGLLQHSLNVCHRMAELCAQHADRLLPTFGGDAGRLESAAALCGLFHDLCKVDFYKQSTRNVKNEETGKWEKVPFYTVEDSLPYGHGEKSVYILSSFLRLSREEAMAIRWHMGGFDDAARGGSFAVAQAFDQHPFALLLHLADMLATHLDESQPE